MKLVAVYLDDLMDKIFNYLKDREIEDIIINGFKTIEYSVELYKEDIYPIESNENTFINLYCGLKNRCIHLDFNNLDERWIFTELDNIQNTLNTLSKSMNYVSIPDIKCNYPPLTNLYNNIEITEVVDFAKKIADVITQYGGIKIAGRISAKLLRHKVLVSNGCEGDYRKSIVSVDLKLIRGRNIAIPIRIYSVKLDDNLLNTITKRIDDIISAIRSISRVGSIKSGKYNIILSPIALGSIISWIGKLVAGDTILDRLSPFGESINSRVFQTGLSIIDDPYLENNPGSKPFDTEGIPTRRVEIFSDGILNTFLHNLYTAKELNMTYTGHDYFNTPKPHSLIFDFKQSADYSDMYNEVDEVLEYLDISTIQHTNVAGDFKAKQSGIGLYYRHGRIVKAFKMTELNDNIFRIFNSIITASRERCWVIPSFDKTPVNTSAVLISDVAINASST